MLKLLQSIAAAAFGVQSSSRHQEDFKQKSMWPFVVGGVIFLLAFVLSLYLVVYLIV